LGSLFQKRKRKRGRRKRRRRETEFTLYHVKTQQGGSYDKPGRGPYSFKAKKYSTVYI
jgi:hypothetical protein